MIGEYIAHYRLFSRNARLFLAGTFFFGFGSGTFWVLLNLYLRELGHSDFSIGRIISFQSVGMLATALAAAWLSKRYPFKFLLLGAAGLSVLAYTGLSLGVSTATLLAASFLAGVGFTFHNVLAAPFFMRNSTPRERIYLFGSAQAVEITAGVIGVAGCGWLARRLGDTLGSPLLGLRITLLVATGLLGFALLPYLFLNRTSGRETAERETGRRSATALRPLLVRLAIPAFIVGTGAGLIIPFLNLYFRDRFHLGTGSIGAVFAIAQALTAVGFLTGPVLARRIGMIRTVAAAEFLSIPFFLLLAFTTSLPVAILAFWFRGALMNMNHPVATNFAMEAVGPVNHALTNSVLMMAWTGAWMISTQVGGWLIEHHGFTPPMLVTVVLYFTSSCLYLYYFRNFEEQFELSPNTTSRAR